MPGPVATGAGSEMRGFHAMYASDERSEVEAFLSSTPALRELGDEVLSQIAARMTVVEVPARSALFEEGDDPDGLYVVLTGRLRVTTGNGELRHSIHELGRGEAFGEIALLNQQQRTASVYAIRDSTLLKLHRHEFDELVERHPSLLRSLSSLVIDRLLRVDRPAGDAESVRTLSVIPTHPTARARSVAGGLASSLSEIGPTMHVTRETVTDALGPGALDEDASSKARLVEWLHEIEQRNRYVVFEADDDSRSWAEWCIREADHLVLVADVETRDRDRTTAWLQTLKDQELAPRIDVVFVHGSSTTRPHDTSAWLGRFDVEHHHVREGNHREQARLTRMLTGRGRGLVLGGGGARGFAHLGVLRALEEAGYELDVVGGTSIGAAIGALYALGGGHNERMHLAEEAFVKHGFLFSFTIPVVSLSSAKKITRILTDTRFAADIRIEDLWQPFFCISTNLTRAEVVVHERGDLAGAIRASLSLPGIFPPVFHLGDLLVDGGVMNNLPVDIMRERLSGGKVIAVDLRPDIDLRVEETQAGEFTGWRVLGDAVQARRRALGVPNILELLVRTMQLGSTRAQIDALAAAEIDLYLRPPVEGTALLDFKAGRRLVDTAYSYTTELIENGALGTLGFP